MEVGGLKLISPIYLYLSRKRPKDKKIALNINWYRNAHYRQSNEAKIQYRQMMAPQIQRLPKFKNLPIHVHYTLFPARKCDGMNLISVIDKFFADALICYSNIPDDNLKFYSSGSWEMGGYDTKNPRCEIEIR